MENYLRSTYNFSESPNLESLVVTGDSKLKMEIDFAKTIPEPERHLVMFN